MSRPRRAGLSWLSWLAIAAWVALLPVAGRLVYRKPDYMDFDVYYRAATRLKDGRQSEIYNLADGASPFRYAPPLLPVLRPLAAAPREQAKLAWFFFQWLCFSAGFAFLLLSLRRVRWRLAAPATAMTALLGIRLCLDTFTIGQVSGLLFLGFSAGLYAWLTKRPRLAGSALFWPAIFKVGPAVLFGLFLGSARPPRRQVYGTAIVWLAAMTAIAAWLAGSWSALGSLWGDWRRIVALDSVYFDSAHYGSQSLNSFLLRLANTGLFSREAASHAHLIVTLLGTAALVAFWFFRKPRTGESRAHFYCLGILAVLWFMPETFKYSLTAALIPLACVLASRDRGWFGTLAAVAFATTIGLAGKDIIDPIDPTADGHLFFRIQELSLPFFATVWLGIESIRLAWRGSIPRFAAAERTIPHPWPRVPEAGARDAVTLLVPLSFERDSGATPQALSRLLDGVRSECTEIVLVPFGEFFAEQAPLHVAARAAASADTGRTRILAPGISETRPEALRRAFLSSNGERILIASLAQPCEPSFFSRALEAMCARGAALVRGNRRQPETRFRIPVRLLSQVYGRHRLGTAFNRLIRAILPVRTTDTHSGNLALARPLALEVFALHGSTGFLFDLEVELVARAQGWRCEDLPLRLELELEKTPDRVLGEAIGILRGLPGLARRERLGCYARPRPGHGISADDWGLSPGVNEGILELARLGAVSRVALMANCAYLESRLDELKQLPSVSLGLHFNLTYGEGTRVGASSPAKFLLRWMKSRFDGTRAELAQSIRAELESQLSRLNKAGVLPVYMDGHHHAHLVPGLIAACAPILRAHGIREVRIPYDPALWLTARWPLNVLALLARRETRHLGFESRPCFYPQPHHFADPALLSAALLSAPDHEIIVHPASRDDVRSLPEPDTYSEGRVVEFQALRMLALAARASSQEALK